ncbi:MAG: cytochrome c oxidase accessory protein CcoG [Hydrogenophaga sp.]|uniref:cytochrome c oxidase accessory protein CcoG n=1 Tax=Hydrogenophaga sp. TaxID=1904254 RepID=UPI0025BF4C50|nr:cytochrome c oxidase accessory protein CcoG [Hydrogenophaga sp.]MBT9553969.1 cytochrome c oxidase accessory protein CcoG [Hydrogenophaga sp.]
MTSRTIPIVPVNNRPAEDKIQVRSITGMFTRWRWAMVWITQLVYYGLPWLTVHGRQAVLFDLEAGRFFLFSAVLYPQDLIYLAGLLVISALLLFFATTVAGRVWCGFVCPQTVYTALFQWIERRTEGDRQARLRLDRGPWNAQKLLRRGGKHLAWALLALWTGFTLVGYFTPIRELALAVPGQLGPWESFWIGFYGLATYGNAGFLRESVCLHMCPYGRFQGSLMDPRTLNVAYDHRRGEPRRAGADSDTRAKSAGHCIDCTLCVQVCPTGIDIRDGLQAACIGCGLCIDACNQVMDKIGAPRGLIRMASLRELGGDTSKPGWSLNRFWRPRVVVYGSLLLIAMAGMTTAFLTRAEVRLNVVRDRSVMARTVELGAVENVYILQLMNASDRARSLNVAVEPSSGVGLLGPSTVVLPPAQAHTFTVTAHMPQAVAAPKAGEIIDIHFEVSDPAHPSLPPVREPSTFIVPR